MLSHPMTCKLLSLASSIRQHRSASALGTCLRNSNAQLVPLTTLRNAEQTQQYGRSNTTNSSFSSASATSSVKYYVACGGSLLLGALLATADGGGSVEAASKDELSLKLLLTQADDLYALAQHTSIYELLHPHKDSGKDEVLWRLSRATYERAKATGSAASDQRTALLREALAYVQEALAINEKNFAVHKWMAILVDEVAATEGSKARILQSFVMKQHMERACELNPTDGTSWYLLGMWHYNIADIPWYQRKAAALLFASPPQSTFEEALKIFLHAEEVEPNFYSQNLLMIGKCYQRLSDRDSAVAFLRRARDHHTTAALATQDDLDACAQAKLLLANLGDK